MTRSATSVLLGKLDGVEKMAEQRFTEIVDFSLSKIASDEVTRVDLDRLRTALIVMSGQFKDAGTEALVRTSNENAISIARSIKSVAAQMGRREIAETVIEQYARRHEDAAHGFTEGVDVLITRAIDEISRQANLSRFDPEPGEGLARRLFSETPVKLARRPGVGVWPALPNQLMAWLIRVMYDMVNTERYEAFATFGLEFDAQGSP